MKIPLCFLLALSASGLSQADTASLENCRPVKDPAARLACYDAISLPAPVGTAASRLNTAAAAATVAVSSAVPAGSAPLVPASAVAATQPGVAPEPSAAFGFENRPTPATTAVEALVSSIPGRFGGWPANGRIRLANGQVWQVSDGSQAYYDLSDPAVRITRGVAGTFFMQITGVAQTPRVRRIQ